MAAARLSDPGCLSLYPAQNLHRENAARRAAMLRLPLLEAERNDA